MKIRIPCKNCLVLGRCKNKEDVYCQLLFEYSNSHSRTIANIKMKVIHKHLQNLVRIWSENATAVDATGTKVSLYIVVSDPSRQATIFKAQQFPLKLLGIVDRKGYK